MAESVERTHAEERLWGAVEIIPHRLYYAPLKFFPPEYDHVEQPGSNAAVADGSFGGISSGASSGTSSGTSNGTSSGQKSDKYSSDPHQDISYFSIDNELIYWNFFLDFGPLNLGQLYRFCSKLKHKLSSDPSSIICYYSGPEPSKRANATFLICAYQMLYLNRSLEDSYFGFQEFLPGKKSYDTPAISDNCSLPPRSQVRPAKGRWVSSPNLNPDSSVSPFARLHPLPPFHDASPIICTYDLSVYDCLCGLEKAMAHGFFSFQDVPRNIKNSIKNNIDANAKNISDTETDHKTKAHFDVDEYEYFEQVENGDLNWIVQNKILAFAGPQAKKLITAEGFCMLTPSDYIPYFQRTNIDLVIRLNKKCYDEHDFVRAGMRHVDHYYLDGSCPDMTILHAVLQDMESVPPHKAFAIHCKAGLGRTGTCIGAYLMKHFRMTAAEVIGWMRICRPGCVIGPQQHFLTDVEHLMWQEGDVYRADLTKQLVFPTLKRDTTKQTEETTTQQVEETSESSPISSSTSSPTPILITPTNQPATATNTFFNTPTKKSDPNSIAITPDSIADTEMTAPLTPLSPLSSSSPLDAINHSSPTSSVSPPPSPKLSSSSSANETLVKSSSSSLASSSQDVTMEETQATSLLSRRFNQYQERQSQKS